MCEIFTLNSRETHSREINVNKFTWNSLNAKFTWNSRVFHVKLNVKFTWSSFHVNFTWGTIGCVAPPPPVPTPMTWQILEGAMAVCIIMVTFRPYKMLCFTFLQNFLLKTNMWSARCFTADNLTQTPYA